ncbi:MAG: Sodium/calcium exchanger protein-domain-containing protein [Monoraphidium minutum]|nr:MAG: Sodium/calcium exchanger protein-domain-containing protein [Monoraphidium minutum]
MLLRRAWSLALAAAAGLGARDAPACAPLSVPAADRCAYVLENAAACWPEGGIQHWMQAHYCWFAPQWRWASILLMLLALALTFGFLLTAAERFFCPALELVAERLKLPPAVAGATLLSFGNGAPDVFTQLAAVKQLDRAAIGMALSEPVGGGLFTSNIVFGAVVLLSTRSHQLAGHRRFIMKDLLFYLFALVSILVAISDSKVEWYEATALAFSYVLYVGATWWLARTDEPVHVTAGPHEVAPEELLGDGWESDSESVDGGGGGGGGDSAFDAALAAEGAAGDLQRPLLAPADTAGAVGAAAAEQMEAGGGGGGGAEGGGGKAGGGGDAARRAAALALLQHHGGRGASLIGGGSAHSTPRWSVGGTPKERGEHVHGSRRPLKRRLQQPFMLLMKFTMPKARSLCGKAGREIGTSPRYQYPRLKAALLPLTAPLLLVAVHPPLVGAVTWGGIAWGAVSGVMASAMVWALYPEDNIPKEPLKGVFACLAFVLSMLWLKLTADVLVQICMLLGTLFGVPPAVLGATVLAWGNSMPDLANNLSLARDGFPTMAITACFASPLFTLLVGTSSAMAYGAWRAGGVLEVPFDKMLAIMYGFAIANLAKFCILIPFVHKWVLGPSLALIALSFYAVYTAVYCLGATGVI